jgi:hypothetical protein
MYQGAEDIHGEIGNLLLGVAPPGWTEIIMVYQVHPDAKELFLRHRCADGTGGSPQSRSISLPLIRACARLRSLMASEDAKPWLAARFALRPDGDFSIDFDYEDELRWDDNPTKRLIRDEFRRSK